MSDLSPTAAAMLVRAEQQLAAYPADQVTTIPDDGDYDHRLIEENVLGARVCTRLTAQEAADWLTKVRAPGTSANQWFVSEDIAEVPCAQFPDTHRHVIVEC